MVNGTTVLKLTGQSGSYLLALDHELAHNCSGHTEIDELLLSPANIKNLSFAGFFSVTSSKVWHRLRAGIRTAGVKAMGVKRKA